ncbi:hypothetical protein KEH51_24705 [[Brevibacterium] frigoritolerans]|uniref:Uncharacterized protein n=1 Tax=Peribacillus frigoritolerans TaxID=450367 RepID=A0A941FKW1_9BACI|nr:hypothetical protein [Peribacillus frigoritolerans]
MTRDETGTKGAKLTGLIEFSTESLVYIHGIDYVGVSKKFKTTIFRSNGGKRPCSIKILMRD